MKRLGYVLFAILVPFLILALFSRLAQASARALPPLKEINYYPKDYAWEEFWANWDLAKHQMDQDLDRIAALGANTVRIFLHPHVFGYPNPAQNRLDDFEEALALIHAHGLKAHVNLFDCRESWNDVSGSKTWLRAVVAPHRYDARIIVWELKNEVTVTDTLVSSWLQELYPYLKEQAGDIASTVSVTNVEWLDDLKNLIHPDLYSLHWYPNNMTWTTAFLGVIDRARQLIGQEDLLIGESGLSTYRYSETSQVFLFNNVLYYANQKGIRHLGVWTLTDFPTGTAQCDGFIPQPDEWYFGLYRTDGTPKPAASILREAFLGHPPASLSPVLLVNTSFEEARPGTKFLKNWWAWDQDWSGQERGEQDCTKARTGRCSARLRGPGGKSVGLYHAPSLPVETWKRYSLEGYVRTENLAGCAQLVFSWFQKDLVWLGQTSSACITEPNLSQWRLVSLRDVLPPPNAAYVQAFIQMSSTTAASIVWFDDVTTLTEHIQLPLIR